MAEFIRARTAEQKQLRLAQIKDVVRRQFAEHPYHEISLTTIADELEWSRANLYKYVSTKEEVFLLLAGDELKSYYEALLAALPEGCGLSLPTIAEVWAGIANAHREYFRLSDLLATIVETNVSVQRLADFKRAYYDEVARMRDRLPHILPIASKQVEPLLRTVYFHAVGLEGVCQRNPLVLEAVRMIGESRPRIDFLAEMRMFIAMCLDHYTE